MFFWLFVMSNFLIVLLLVIFWLSNSTIFQGFLLFCGVIFIIATFLIYKFMIQITLDHFNENFNFFEKLPKSPKMMIFISKTIFEICESSMLFMKNLLINKKIDPSFIELTIQKIENNSPILMFIAHSITVTPGSITIVEGEKNKLIVHCLYKEIRNNFEEMHNYEDFVKFMKKKS